MSLREKTQRRMFNMAFAKARSMASEEDRQHFDDAYSYGLLDDVYQLSLGRFISEGLGVAWAFDESQTPILDKILEFFKWLWESGALLELIKLIGGGLSISAIAGQVGNIQGTVGALSGVSWDF